MDLREHAETMSLDGKSHGENIEGLNQTELRTVMYIVVFPNLLISLHPDYVMTHRVTPLEPAGRTSSARGPSRSRPSPSRTSTRRTPWTSGT